MSTFGKPRMLAFVRSLCIALACLWLLLSGCAQADELLLSHGKLVDPERHTIQSIDILIRDGKISQATEPRSADCKEIDLSGKWIIPALIDLHVHFSNNPLPNGHAELFDVHEAARVMLYCGVGAFLDLANHNYESLFHERDQQRADPEKFNNESDIYCAGAAFGHWNLSSASATPEKIRQYIQKFNPDVIKLIYGSDSIDRDELCAAITEATKDNVKTVVHIGDWSHARNAIECGATAVTHFFDDQPIPTRLAKYWSKSQTISIPTMAVQCDMAKFCQEPELLDAPLLREIESADAIASFQKTKNFSASAKRTLEWQQEDLKNDMDSFATLAKFKVPMLDGCDCGNIGTFQGYSTHRELVLMHEGGYTAWQALAAGTTKAAEFLGRPAGLKPGETAELVILDADPIADINNTQKIFATIHHGKLVDRNALLTLINQRHN